MESQGMKIGELAARTGVPVKTIRFWEDERLVPEPARTGSGYRQYDPAAVERLAFIRQAQAAGFRLDQIRQILDIADSGDRPCAHVGSVIEQRLAEVDARIAELEATRDRLRVLGRRAAAQDPADCRGLCSIIEPPARSGGAEARRHVSPSSAPWGK
jgi:DNA-binding transcriptional MerR regulator